MDNFDFGSMFDFDFGFVDNLNNWLNSTDMNLFEFFPIQLNPWINMSVAIVGGVVGMIGVVVMYIYVIMKPRSEDPKVNAIGDQILKGAIAFIWREYLYITIFSIFVGIFISVFVKWQTGVAFYAGAIISALCGIIGMSVAVQANVRTTVAAQKGLNAALRVAFHSGAVMGFSVVSMSALGLAIVHLIFDDPDLLSGFGFGASTIALFARVGGGIFTKAADVGSDLVGKVEENLPEDDPRNAGVICDNVGDNVGDVAGLGSDLFESYVGSLVAAVALGSRRYGDPGVAIAFWITGVGVVSSLVGTLFVRTKENAKQSDLLNAMRLGIFVSAFLIIIFSLVCSWVLFNDQEGWRIWMCIVVGLVSGVTIGFWTEYCTSFAYAPTLSIARSGRSGVAPVIIQGISVGMLSTVVPALILVAAQLITYYLSNTYGTAIASVGMLCTLGITLATDSYGPVADNAGGIAEMAQLPEEVRERTDALDALGNTTAATGKGFAIASAVFAALALIQAYAEVAGIDLVNCLDPIALAGMLLGSLLPYVLAALTMLSVGRGAQVVIKEVRRQFAEIPGLREGTAECDSSTCVGKCTTVSLQEMFLPGAVAVFTPIIVGFVLGTRALGGTLTGTILGGFMLAVYMANSGGAWDNAKKACEAGLLGPEFAKGTPAHHANVEGDCVGDPFKDVSGPSLNVLAKMMAHISLVFAPRFKEDFSLWWFGALLASILVMLYSGFLLTKSRFENSIALYYWFLRKYDRIRAKIEGRPSDSQLLPDSDEIEDEEMQKLSTDLEDGNAEDKDDVLLGEQEMEVTTAELPADIEEVTEQKE